MEIILASNNEHKLKEIRAKLKNGNINMIQQQNRLRRMKPKKRNYQEFIQLIFHIFLKSIKKKNGYIFVMYQNT